MKCPTDGNILKAGEVEAHAGYGCSSCKGAWLPKSYVASLKYTKEFEPEKFWTNLTNKPHHITQFRCPSNCGVLHSIDDLAGIKYCSTCLGMWFESSTLTMMLKGYRNKKSL